MSVVLAATAALLFTAGCYLLLQRTLTRVVLGIVLLGHGTVVLLQVAGGRAGEPPIVGPETDGSAVVDPLPHALALTAIVITFGITAFLLALAYRSWALTHDDQVQDDLEDRLVARRVESDLARAAAREAAEQEDLTEFGPDDPGIGTTLDTEPDPGEELP
ncbi:Na(+)/H(+) antiporter subunit C [Actinomarinicola tropica]|uniref:Na(+)/H(+) antiporter subunit C n=1 Tax=Actinomarinicola tropica TaxID=2789776 RepID=A0A5Q2RME9_9ACTN|nr:Na(+)/H(+) antiporter subunit C [Actinomarinicola tropica]QGG96122.1 Na(+)/H(+) antiporter subunit C [Actinomarinicola tropica]